MENREAMYERNWQAVNLLMANSADAQTDDRTKALHGGSKFWLKEFCTVCVRGPRQSGHTTVINSLLQHFGDNVIVVTPNSEMGKHIKTDNICPQGSFFPKFRGKFDVLNAVIVDATMCMRPEWIKKIYDEVSTFPLNDPFFVIMME